MSLKARAATTATLSVLYFGCTGPNESAKEEPRPLVTVTSQTNPDAETATTVPLPARDPAVQPLLIKHGWDLPDAQFVNSNAPTIEALGYDGVVFRVPSSSRILSQHEISYEQLASELAPVAAAPLTTMKHNFVIIYNGPVGGFSAEDWRIPHANAANLARAAQEAGLAGIVYDNENYDNKLRWHAEGSESEKAALHAAALARGEEFMTALKSGWPNVTLMTLHGPGLSDELTADEYSPSFPYNDVAFVNPLLGRFFMGMALAAAGSGATLIDGGEIYTMRTAEQYELAYRWMMQGLPARSDMVPEQLRGRYPDVVDAAFGVYDRPWERVPMNSDIWRDTLVLALQRTDLYVWAYTERFDWLGTGHPSESVPQDWIEATAEAKAIVSAEGATN